MFKGGLPATDGGSSTPDSTSGCSVPSSASGTQQRQADLRSAAEGETRRFSARTVAVTHGTNTTRSDRRSIATRDERAKRTEGAFSYQGLLVAIDLIAVAIAAFTMLALGVDSTGSPVDVVFAAVLPVAWIAFTGANRAYEHRYVGVGNAEFERVFRAFMQLSMLAVVVFYLFDVPIARGFAIPALVAALGIDLVARFAARKALHRRRRRGMSMTSVLAVGGTEALESFAAMLHHDRHAGMKVVAGCLPSGTERDEATEAELAGRGVPILGDVDSIREAVRISGARTVAVLSGQVRPEKLRWISWQLEGTDTDLVVSPGLAEIGGRRLHIQPVAGLPLLHIEEPTLAGFSRVVKSVFDRTVAAFALLLLAPILITIGLLVRFSSKGPALFLQTRVGRNGREFKMVKFRSMVANAEELKTDLLDENENDGVLFKMRSDPRVTPLGRVLRRFSLDELPQLLNVLSGSMSLVGPRPPLPSEVAQYHDDARRRLLVKPGLTGLWQVSGRSDLSWEESVRLDLRYVEDWSLSLDMVVLWKTARAVMKAEGAY